MYVANGISHENYDWKLSPASLASFAILYTDDTLIPTFWHQLLS